MTNHRILAVALALATAACEARNGWQATRSAASVEPIGVGCLEADCSWLDAPDACQQIANGLGFTGTFTGARIVYPLPPLPPPPAGVTTVTTPAGTFTVTLATGPYSFGWSATTPVDFVFSRNPKGAAIYAYDPAVLGDTALDTYLGAAPSHVDFCFGPHAPQRLTVTKTANTAFKRTWSWSIAKSSPVGSVQAAIGETVDVAYAVTVAAAAVDSDFVVTGTITVTNSTPTDAMGVSIVDGFGGATATIDCGPFEGTLPAGWSVSCTYALATSAAIDGTNVATVSTTGAVLGDTASAQVAFGAPAAEVDACVNVSDDRAGVLGTACADASPVGWSYNAALGPYSTCDASGEGYAVVNTASFAAPSGATGSASATVTVHVPCPIVPGGPPSSTGCTLTQGYWKTHSRRGPAPYDTRWKNVGPLEEATPFFLSGLTWYQLFWSPVRGSTYDTLAHQYMAAKLNILAGADPTAAASALAAAEAYFAASKPWSPLTWAERARLLLVAGVLDRYNSGLIGPGHCTETTTGKCDGRDPWIGTRENPRHRLWGAEY